MKNRNIYDASLNKLLDTVNSNFKVTCYLEKLIIEKIRHDLPDNINNKCKTIAIECNNETRSLELVFYVLTSDVDIVNISLCSIYQDLSWEVEKGVFFSYIILKI